MKTINRIALLFFASMSMVSCDSYLDRQEDESMTFEKIWLRRKTTEKYLNNVWGFMPDDTDWDDGMAWIGAADEAVLTFNRDYRKINYGSWSPADVPYAKNLWPQLYKGIREATVFIQNTDNITAPDVLPAEIMQWEAEARFARAYYYFLLVRTYGPVILLGDDLVDFNQSDLSISRNTFKECVDYIESELTTCSNILPINQESTFYGKPTKGACLAMIARLKLYSARPLFNGNPLYKGITNQDGTKLFSATPDIEKWKAAATASKAVIDMGNYELYKDPSGDPLKSYQGAFVELWNNELIFGRFHNAYELRVVLVPRSVGGIAYGGCAPTQQQVDAYAMSNGVYPITGYQADGEPIIDGRAEYKDDGFTSFAHPIDQKKGEQKKKKTFNMYVNREPRFYASVLWSGADWLYTKTSKEVVFAFNGNSGPGPSHDYPKSGYMIRKFMDPTQNTEAGQWGNVTWPTIRLAEIYLNYVEALNEYDPSNGDIITYLNFIRERAGVPNIEIAYPEAVNNQPLMRELIRKERRIELAFETHRYFDTRTWMISEKVDKGAVYGMNIMAPVKDGPSVTPAEFWKRTKVEERIFEPKHYLFPMHQSELDRNEKLTQNYGW